MKLNDARSFLYTLAKLLGDWNALRRGKVVSRVARRLVGKTAGRGIGRMFR